MTPRSRRGTARRALLAAPAALYRWRLGWLLGRRFLALTYRGRRTGHLLQTVLEVIRFDPATHESVVLSAYGPTARWYLSLREAPPVCVQQGRRRYRPVHRFPDHAEAVEIAAELCRKHPLEARLAPLLFRALGATGVSGPAGAREVPASLPMVAVRPRGETDGGSWRPEPKFPEMEVERAGRLNLDALHRLVCLWRRPTRG